MTLSPDAIFRLSGTVQRDPTVDSWFAEDPQELQSIAEAWFTLMRQCGNDVRELIHDGCPTACVEDAAFAYVDSAALRGLIEAAYNDIRARLAAERTSQEK